MRNIMEAVQEHLQAVIDAGFAPESIVGVFCYGSQNYNFHDEHSDVDTKAIIIPTMKELCFSKPVSREIHLTNGEHCEVKDIREIVNMFRKQNLNFIEILFTPYCYVNPNYQELWRFYFTKYAERIAHYNPRQTVMSICGQAIHTLKQNPADGKKYADGLRMYRFLDEYLKGKSYIEAMTMPDNPWREHVMDFKRGRLAPIDVESEALADSFRKLKDSYSDNDTIDEDISYIMNEGAMCLIAVRNHLPIAAFL